MVRLSLSSSPSRADGASCAGLERNDYYITYELVGNMLRNSRGIVPRNNVVMDTLWGIAGTVRRHLFSFPVARFAHSVDGGQIGFPFWRIFEADGAVLKEAKKLKK